MARGGDKEKHQGRGGSAGARAAIGVRNQRGRGSAAGARLGGEMCNGLCPTARDVNVPLETQHNAFGVLMFLRGSCSHLHADSPGQE